MALPPLPKVTALGEKLPAGANVFVGKDFVSGIKDNVSKANERQTATGSWNDLVEMAKSIKNTNAIGNAMQYEEPDNKAKFLSIFGAPPCYSKIVDYRDRVYSELWGDLESKENHNKLVPIKLTVGSPRSVVLQNVENLRANVVETGGQSLDFLSKQKDKVKALVTRKTADDADEDEKKGSFSTSRNFNILDTYTFGPVWKSIDSSFGNTFFASLNLILDSMAAGLRSQGIPDEINPYMGTMAGLTTYDPKKYASENNPFFFILGSEETSLTETVSNQAGESALASLGNKSSELAREINFMSNGNMVEDLSSTLSSVTGGFIGKDTVKKIFDTIGNAANEINKRFGTKELFDIVVKGSQLFLPNVWKSSSFDKKYSISFRLSSPSGDYISIARHVGIPLAHILAASLPSQTGPHSVTKPHLVQVDSPGQFSVRMGMISNMTIRKGGKDNIWSNHLGLARSIDITIDIVDLFELIPAPTDFYNAIGNEQIRDFLGNIVGGQLEKDPVKSATDFTDVHNLTKKNRLESFNLSYGQEQREIFANSKGLADVGGLLQDIGGLFGNSKITNIGLDTQRALGGTKELSKSVTDAIAPITGWGSKPQAGG